MEDRGKEDTGRLLKKSLRFTAMRLRLAGYPATRLGKLMRATTIEKVVKGEDRRRSTTIEKVVEVEEEDRSRTTTTIEKVVEVVEVEGEDRRRTFF